MNFTGSGPTEIQIAQSRPAQNALDFAEYRRNPRKTHYELGTDADRDHYQSITKCSYRNTEAAQEKANLSENTKQDLRSHHFVLGFHSVDDPSEYKREYLEREQQQSKIDKAEMQNFLRKHNHDFGDRNTYYRTSYATSHNDQYDKYRKCPPLR